QVRAGVNHCNVHRLPDLARLLLRGLNHAPRLVKRDSEHLSGHKSLLRKVVRGHANGPVVSSLGMRGVFSRVVHMNTSRSGYSWHASTFCPGFGRDFPVHAAFTRFGPENAAASILLQLRTT